MKILVCIPHFYNRTRPYESDVMGSSVEPLQERVETVRYCLRRLEALLSDNSYNLITSPTGRIGFDTIEAIPNAITGDICLCFSRDDHFFGELSSGAIVKGLHNDGDPACSATHAAACSPRTSIATISTATSRTTTPFSMPSSSTRLRISIASSATTAHVLPSRFELAGKGEAAWKTYIDDGAFSNMKIEPPAGAQPTLRIDDWRRSIEFELTRSPFCGFYVITNGQLRSWMDEPDFLEPVPAMLASMNALEVVQIPMMGRVPIYKPSKRNANFLEIHHVPNRLCNATVPQNLMKKAVQPEIDRRIATALVRNVPVEFGDSLMSLLAKSRQVYRLTSISTLSLTFI